MKTAAIRLKNLAFLFVLAGLISCEGPEGPTGPTGPKGDTGPTGAKGSQGIAGVDGNANVVCYTYGQQTFISTVVFAMTNISKERIDSCIVLAYFSPTSSTNTWVPVPGVYSIYLTRNYLQQSKDNPNIYKMYVSVTDYSGVLYQIQLIWYKFKIYVVSPSVINPGGKSAQIDLSTPDYLDKYLEKIEE